MSFTTPATRDLMAEAEREYVFIAELAAERGADDRLIATYRDDNGTEAGVHALRAIGGFEAIRTTKQPDRLARDFRFAYLRAAQSDTAADDATPAAPAEPLRSTADAITGVVAALRDRYHQQRGSRHGFLGHATGLATLDNLLGGLEAGRVSMLMAAPGTGKTTLANQIAYTVAAGRLSNDRTPVVYVTYENPADDLIAKHMARVSDLSAADLMRGKLHGTAIDTAQAIVADEARSLYYIDGTASTTVASIAGALQQAMAAHPNGGHPLIVIDYLQQLARTSGHGGEDIRIRVGNVSRQLSDLAKASGAHVLAISSMNRAGYANGAKPSQASAKESGDLEFDASAVITLQADQEAHAGLHHDSLILSVVKNRYGSCGTVRLNRDRTTLQITEVK